eukprot:GABV01000634.1.p2 GENE.GABV01000634.1~~GABV01000634.1.p2  ORF type:complete len:182 (-),score=48.90 GABV01000634.1:425-970(-)
MRKLMRPAFPGNFAKPENFEDKKWRRLVRFLPGFERVEAKNSAEESASPGPRSAHTFTKLENSEALYVFGGQDFTAKPSDPASTPSARDPAAFADLYQFTPSTQLWRRIPAVYADGSKVGVLAGHSAVVYQNCVYFFGSNTSPAAAVKSESPRAGGNGGVPPPALPIEQPENTKFYKRVNW